MDSTGVEAKIRKYQVRAPDGTARIYTVSYAPKYSTGALPSEICPKTSQNDSGYSLSPPHKRNEVQTVKATPSVAKCMPFRKKNSKVTPNSSDAYVILDTNENKVLILDNGKPFKIPVSISGKYTITNTKSSLNIRINKDKFGTKRPANSTLSGNVSDDKVKIDKQFKGSANKEPCEDVDALEKSGWFQPTMVKKKTVNPACQAKGKQCCCNKCG